MDLDPSVDGSLLLSNIIAQAPRAREAYRVHTEVSHSAIVSPSVPSRVKIDVPSAESRIELYLKDMEISTRRPKQVVFDLEGLIRRFSIDEVIRLEDVRPVAQGVGR